MAGLPENYSNCYVCGSGSASRNEFWDNIRDHHFDISLFLCSSCSYQVFAISKARRALLNRAMMGSQQLLTGFFEEINSAFHRFDEAFHGTSYRRICEDHRELLDHVMRSAISLNIIATKQCSFFLPCDFLNLYDERGMRRAKILKNDSGFVGNLFATLEALDRSSYNSFEAVYAVVFARWGGLLDKEARPADRSDVRNLKVLINLLCEWAVTSERSATYRGAFVASLLELKQEELLRGKRDKPVAWSENIFQDHLLDYLDFHAPSLNSREAAPTREAQSRFQIELGNLVNLFSEFMQRGVFSYASYIRVLRSRGYVEPLPQTQTAALKAAPAKPVADKCILSSMEKLNMDSEGIREGHCAFGRNEELERERAKQARHLEYVRQFPELPTETGVQSMEDDGAAAISSGVSGSGAYNIVHQVSEAIMGLFAREACMEPAERNTIKEPVETTHSYELLLERFLSLPYKERVLVTPPAASRVLESFREFANGKPHHLPSVKQLSFLFSLMETAQNVNGLIDLILDILFEIFGVKERLESEKSPLAKTYVDSLVLLVVGFLHRYNHSLCLSKERVVQVFDLLCRLLVDPRDSDRCSSARRCTLGFLHDLYHLSVVLKRRYPFSFAYALLPKVRSEDRTKRNQEIIAHSTQLFCSSGCEKVFGICVDDYCTSYIRAVIIEEAFYEVPYQPVQKPTSWDRTKFADLLACPRSGLSAELISVLEKDFSARCAFMFNTMIAIAECSDPERLYDISILFAEMVAGCPLAPSELLAVLEAFCLAPLPNRTYSGILSAVELKNPSVRENLATFVAILAARRCFGLKKFFKVVVASALRGPSSIYDASPPGRVYGDGARFTCHILLRLLGPVDNIDGVMVAGFPRESECDRLLLLAAQNSLHSESVGFCLSYLYVLVEGDIDSIRPQASEDAGAPLPVSHTPLEELAKLVFVKICSRQWFHERFLYNSHFLGALFEDIPEVQGQKLGLLISDLQRFLSEMTARERASKLGSFH